MKKTFSFRHYKTCSCNPSSESSSRTIEVAKNRTFESLLTILLTSKVGDGLQEQGHAMTA